MWFFIRGSAIYAYYYVNMIGKNLTMRDNGKFLTPIYKNQGLILYFGFLIMDFSWRSVRVAAFQQNGSESKLNEKKSC